MSQTPTISSVAEEISSLKAGYRAWFWLCPDVEAPHPPLLIKSFRADPDMTILREQIDTLPAPEDAETCMGFASVNQSGTFQFGSSILSKDMLVQLAEWTSRHVEKHQDLCRLKDAVFINVNSKGVVIEKIEDENLWTAIPDPITPGTIGETSALLKRLKPGRDFWFYMCSDPSKNCFLSLGSSKRDPDGISFGKNIADIRLRFRAADTVAQGILRALPSGNLAFLTSDNVADTASIVNRLLEKYPEQLRSLQQARIIQLNEGSFGTTIIVGGSNPKERRAPPKKDLHRLKEVLEGIDTLPQLYFWFAENRSMLIIESDKTALKTAVKEIGAKGIRGQVFISKKGWLEFRTKQSAPNFVRSLAGFVKENIADWPSLIRIRGARMTQRNSAGEIIDRQKDDDAWSSID